MNKALMGLLFSLIAIFVFFSPCFAQKITLKQAIDEAVFHNPKLLKADQEIRSAQAGIWEAVTPSNPEFFTELEEIPAKNRSISDYGEKRYGFTQAFEFPMAYYYRKKWNNLRENQTRSDYYVIKNDTISEIKVSFYRVLILENKRNIHEEIYKLTNQLYHKALIRVEAGDTAPYDTLRVKLDLAEVGNTLLTFESEYETALYELKMLLGRKKQDTLEIDGEIVFSPVPMKLETLKQTAMDNHPLLRTALSHAKQKEIEKKLSWIGLVPNFELRYFRQEFRDSSPAKAWGGEIGLSVPFWSYFKERGEIKSASYNLNAARWHIEEEKRNVLLDIENAYSDVVVAEKHVTNYQNNILREVQELVRIASRSYEEGEMGYLEVAEAYRTMNKANAGYYDALFTYLSAQAHLEKAVGITLFDVE
ncbi:MAG: TolC family protein [Candidatus Latescibacteria bacterium]|nr:TolC family protein [Candidatus Latescibacterota bacterium]